MVSLAAWAGLPLLVVAVGTGIGLLAERLARAKLSSGVLAPLGVLAGICVLLPVYRLGGSAVIAAPLLIVLALAGLVLARRELAQRLRPGWSAAAGLLAWLVYLAPVLLSGHWTWTGYNFVNDPANNLLFIEQLAAHGATVQQAMPPSSAARIVVEAIGAHYPFGAFVWLATVKGLLGGQTAALYQPFIALTAGLAASAATVLARRIGLAGRWAAALGALCVCASLTYDYSSHGGIKEIGVVLVVITAATLAREGLDARWHPGALALAAIALAAGITILSAAAAPYVALLALAVLAAYALEPGRPPVRRLAVVTGVALLVLAVALAPSIKDALDFYSSTAPPFSGEGGIHGPNSTVVLGYLARALPPYQALGVWPGNDYRLALTGARWAFTIVAMAITVGLIAVAAVSELRRRRLGALLVLAPTFLTWLIAAPRLAPYPEAKLLVILSPAAVFAMGIGAWRLTRTRALRVPALLAAGIVAAGVVLSDAIAYHQIRLAPADRMTAIADAAAHAPRGGLLLFNEWEEYAKYFARDRQINTSQESFSPAVVQLRVDVPIFATTVDLDDMNQAYVQSFPAMLLRSRPDASRPPADYTRTYANAFYEVWRRDPTRPHVQEHLPLNALNRDGAAPKCADVKGLAARAAPGEQVAGSPAPQEPALDVPKLAPRGWVANGIPGTVTPKVPATVTGDVAFARGGGYRIWMRGGTGRRMTIRIDGRDAGSVAGVNTPGGWLSAGYADVPAGSHRVSLVRPGGGLAPGDGYSAEVGPVVFQPSPFPGLVSVPPQRAAATFCHGDWDWVERVKPAA
jgi:hypothetical protein